METEDSLLHLQVPATCPPPEPDQSSPCLPSHFLKIHLNNILPSMSGSSKWSLSFRFLHQNPIHTTPLPHTCYMLAYLILLDLIPQIIFGEQYSSLNSSLLSFIHSSVSFYFVGPNILLNTPFSNTFSLCSSLYVSN